MTELRTFDAPQRFLGVQVGCRVSVLERLGVHRALAREEFATLLALDFDRLIPAHGAIVPTGGREALREAYSWLGFSG